MILTRFAYTPTEVQGELVAGVHRFFTIERPWVPGPNLGGVNFESCIPDGDYTAEPYRRQNGDWSIRLVNPALGVYRTRDSRPDGRGRWACLIHIGNYAHDVVGCIAPGFDRGVRWSTKLRRSAPWVGPSGAAMEELLGYFRQSGDRTLSVRPGLGTRTRAAF